MNESLSFIHFLNHLDIVGKIVFGFLVFGSIISWYIVFAKSIDLFKLRTKGQKFLENFKNAPSLTQVIETIKHTKLEEPYSQMLYQGLLAIDHSHDYQNLRDEAVQTSEKDFLHQMIHRSLNRAMLENKFRFNAGQSVLATLASSAPFVGLLGTVWGIYHALLAISITGQSSLDKVAGPVGEALIMTGIGLAVAIPAAIAYNVFSHITRNMQAKLNLFAHDVYTLLTTGSKKSSQMNSSLMAEKIIKKIGAQSNNSDAV